MNYRALYGENADENEVRERYRSVAEGFRALKGEPPESFYSSSGRAEIIGNHTDHNQGKVIVAAISCDIVAAVKKSERKGASDRSIQTLRSDTYFVSYCTDGLIARRRTGVHTT